MRSLFSLLILISVFLPALSSAEPTPRQRTAFWNKMAAQYAANPQVVYNDEVSAVPDYPAYLISNEHGYFSLVPPTGTASDLQIGFATTLNFNIAAARRSKTLIIADQSIEAQAMVASFYRSLFLVSKTPEEFVANLAGLTLKRRETIESVFTRIDAGEMPSVVAMEALKSKMAKLVTNGRITALDMQFVEYVLLEYGRVLPPSLSRGQRGVVSIFRNSNGPSCIARNFSEMYDLRKREDDTRKSYYDDIEAFQWSMARIYPGYSVDTPKVDKQVQAGLAELTDRVARLSFLTKDGYAHLRGLYEDDEVFFAKGGIETLELWKAMGAFAQRGGRTVTDVYTSNIIALSPALNREIVESVRDGLGAQAARGFNMYMANRDPRVMFNAGPLRFDRTYVEYYNAYAKNLPDLCIDLVARHGLR